MLSMKINTRLYAVRGAVCCANTDASLSQWVPALYRSLLEQNALVEDDIVSVIFSVTPDLTALNPATALRRAGLAGSLPLFACAEPSIDGALQGVIRVLVTFYGDSAPVPVYMNGAEALRPDLAGLRAGSGQPI